jgi:hypothetical protein
MSKKLEQLELQKLFQEYNYLVLDDQYKKELISKIQPEFLARVGELRKNPPQQTPPSSPKKKEKKNLPITPELKNKIKKLYREIAKVTHPDKVGSKEYEELYIKATKASEEYNLFELYDICSVLGILYSIELEDKDILRIRINEKRDELKKIESSFIWLYINAKNEEEKENLIQLFIDQTNNL